MTAGLTGALAGLVIGYGMFEAVNQVARRVEKEATKKVLRLAGIVDLIVFPVVGYFVAPMIFGGA